MAIEAVFTDRKVDELEKAVNVAAKDPALYGIDEAELERRRRWTSNARTQVPPPLTSLLLIILLSFREWHKLLTCARQLR